jgi:hypothetical protein
MTEEGTVRGHRRTVDWTRVGHGLYRREGTSDLHAWQLALPPTGRITHLTAAAARGWWLPPLPQGLPVFAAVDRCSTRPERAGLHVIRRDAVVEAHEEDGLRLDPPGEVLLACAGDLELLDLLVLTDSALHRGDCSREEIAAAAAPRRKGARLLRRVVDLCDVRAESPWESVLRLLHVSCDVGVERQHEIRSADGGFVARADLLLTGTRTIHEYDGEVHLTREQQHADLERSRRLRRRRGRPPRLHVVRRAPPTRHGAARRRPGDGPDPRPRPHPRLEPPARRFAADPLGPAPADDAAGRAAPCPIAASRAGAVPAPRP